MSNEYYFKNNHFNISDLHNRDSISEQNIVLTESKINYENDPTIHDNCSRREQNLENELSELSDILNYIKDTVESLEENDKTESPELLSTVYNNVKNDHIYDTIKNGGVEQEYPFSELREDLQNSQDTSTYYECPTRSFTEVIRKKIKILFSRKNLKCILPLPESTCVHDDSGKIYYEVVGGKTREETFESIYEQLPHPTFRSRLNTSKNLESHSYSDLYDIPKKIINIQKQGIYQNIQASKLSPRIEPKILDIEQKFELHYQNIPETSRENKLPTNEVYYENQLNYEDYCPELPPRPALSVPLQIEYKNVKDVLPPSKFSYRRFSSIPSSSRVPPVRPSHENVLSRSLRALNRLSLFGSQNEPNYEGISNFYHEIQYKNSVPLACTDYIYGTVDKVAGGSDITYDEIRWSLAKDKKRKPFKQIIELLCTVVCTVLYTADVGSDISLAFRYWSSGDHFNCCLTLSFVYLASFVDVLYCMYRKELATKNIIFWFRFISLFLLNIRGIAEYVYLLKLEYKNIKKPIDNKLITRSLQLQRAKVAALNSYEGIFEACPQIILQLYLMLLAEDFNLYNVTSIMQVVTVTTSLCSCGRAFISMEKGLRLEDYGTNDLSILGIIVQYLWLSPLTASRLLSTSLLLASAPVWLWTGAALHWGLGSVLYWRLNEAPLSMRKAVNASVYGARILLSPYEPEYVRHVVLALNVVHVLQNGAATTCWAAITAPSSSAYLVAAICASNLAAHVLGLLFAVLFNKCRHSYHKPIVSMINIPE